MSNPPQGIIGILGKTIETTEITDLTVSDGDIATHVSTKITGLPTQTQDLNMGTNDITNTTSLQGIGTIADVGLIRVANNTQGISWRNAGDSNNIELSVTAADNLNLSNLGQGIDLNNKSILNFDALREFGTEASIGAIRLVNTSTISWRDSGNTTDIDLSVDANDDFLFGSDININGNNIINTGTLTLPTATDTLVGRSTTDTLSNKTIAASTISGDMTFNDAIDISVNTTTGTSFGTTTTQKISFYGVTPVVQPTALTAAETTLTFVDENTPDFSISSLTLVTPAGFASLDEAQAYIEVVANTQARVNEIETKLQALGLLA